MTPTRAVMLGMAAVFASSACVTTKTYDRKIAEFESFKKEEADRVRAARARILTLEQDTAKLSRRLYLTEETLGKKSSDLEGASAQVAALKQRLDGVGQDVKSLTAEREEVTASLALTRARLEELRVHAVASETQAQTFRDLVSKLHGMIDAGKLKVVVRQGHMLIALPSDVLFDSGRTVVRGEAQSTLAEVAAAIRDIRDRKFLVVGHTDNVPIRTARFPSNWELSAGRAVAVARVLMARGVSPQNVGIAGQAEFDAVVPNDTALHRQLNRRIEIVLEPKLTELPAIPAATDAPVSIR
jgi:chemotaxis protein MotB